MDSAAVDATVTIPALGLEKAPGARERFATYRVEHHVQFFRVLFQSHRSMVDDLFCS
jgi:hypothetical protein